MTKANPAPTPYVITAKTREGIIEQTRAAAASAVILASRWIAAGYASVRIIDPKGDLLTPEMFRAKFADRRSRVS